MRCYICGKESPPAQIDNHHVDCAHGSLSDETVTLCRRCHRTYHDLGVEWFDDEYLDRAIEIENRRREINYANLKDPVIPLQLMERKDVKRSAYWNKIHGIKEEKGAKPKMREGLMEHFIQLCITPICGWDWLEAHSNDTYPEQWIEIRFDDKVVAKMAASSKRGAIRKAMAAVEANSSTTQLKRCKLPDKVINQVQDKVLQYWEVLNAKEAEREAYNILAKGKANQ